MDGFKSRKGPWEWARTTDTWLLLIFIMFISPPPFLHMCLVRYPQIPMGSMAAIFGYKPPACATRVVTRSFSTSIPNPWSPLQQLANKIKCSPQQDDLLYMFVKSARCVWLSPIQTESMERMFIFKTFFS